MGAMYNFTIDRSLKTPAYRQLYFQISEYIEKGKILSGEKLPKIRELASNLGIARNTVEAAYKQLALEGYAKGHRGIGYVVEDLDLSVFDGNASGRSDSALIEASENVRNIFPLGSDLGCKYDFAYGNKDLGALPIDIMRAMIDKAFRANNFTRKGISNASLSRWSFNLEPKQHFESWLRCSMKAMRVWR